MKAQILLVLPALILLVFGACKKSDEPADENGNSFAESETIILIGDKEYVFNLSGEEIPDKVVFTDVNVSIKLVNNSDQVLRVKLSGPDIYGKSNLKFMAKPNIPFEVTENLASITLYDPNEVPLTNDATKYLIDGEVSVSKLTTNEIELSYDGEGFPGGNFANNTEGRFEAQLSLKLMDFGLLDIRN